MRHQKMIDEYATQGKPDWPDDLGQRQEGSYSQKNYSDAVAARILQVGGLGADFIRKELQKIAKGLIERTISWP